jgi:hypothetical protein
MMFSSYQSINDSMERLNLAVSKKQEEVLEEHERQERELGEG